VAPKLSAKVTVSARHVATVTVSDAGQRVNGATVSFGSGHRTTPANGTVTIALGSKKGTRTITVSRGGYVTLVLKVVVR
jgi:flavin reductase (DIM6/NTAB) family NADH-FMN oxidoreductase RutF